MQKSFEWIRVIYIIKIILLQIKTVVNFKTYTSMIFITIYYGRKMFWLIIWILIDYVLDGTLLRRLGLWHTAFWPQKKKIDNHYNIITWMLYK